jgi:hypothetical protein
MREAKRSRKKALLEVRMQRSTLTVALNDG